MNQEVLVAALTLCLLALSRALPAPLPTAGKESGQWKPVYQLSREWGLWKTEHRRSYGSDNEELERHLVWLSNMKYIEGHNANEHMFGYRLSMNQYGDMVGRGDLVDTNAHLYQVIAGSPWPNLQQNLSL